MKKRLLILLLLFCLILSGCTKKGDGSNEDNIAIGFLKENHKEEPYSDFLTRVNNNEIFCVYFTNSTDIDFLLALSNTDSGIEVTKYEYIKYDSFKKEMLEKDIIVKDLNEIYIPAIYRIAFFVLVPCVSLLFLFVPIAICIDTISRKKEEKEQEKVKDEKTLLNCSVEFNDDDEAQLYKLHTPIKKFSDIAGLSEVKKDVACLVDFLKNSEKFKEAGAQLPHGVIFYGPPGTGKTLLAKAISAEAGVSFIFASAAQFDDKYVGVGAARVRSLFKTAMKYTPCIIFIDEIDALCRKRNGDDGCGRQTINELLIQMDGFTTSDNILVIGATNTMEDLDEAFLREGRFTNKYCIPLPANAKERFDIFKLYAGNKKIDETVNFEKLAQETVGASPAKIEAIMNEAAIISVQQNVEYINNEIIEAAATKIMLNGHIKENQKERDKKTLKIIAYHEAGHALLAKLNNKNVSKVSILATTSGIGGVTFLVPEEKELYSATELENEIKELYAGRCAEYIYLGDKKLITTGASNDIKKATNIIDNMIKNYGMLEEYGPIALTFLPDENITQKMSKIAKQLEEETINILKANINKLQLLAEKLLEKETIYESEIDEILGKKI